MPSPITLLLIALIPSLTTALVALWAARERAPRWAQGAAALAAGAAVAATIAWQVDWQGWWPLSAFQRFASVALGLGVGAALLAPLPALPRRAGFAVLAALTLGLLLLRDVSELAGAWPLLLGAIAVLGLGAAVADHLRAQRPIAGQLALLIGVVAAAVVCERMGSARQALTVGAFAAALGGAAAVALLLRRGAGGVAPLVVIAVGAVLALQRHRGGDDRLLPLVLAALVPLAGLVGLLPPLRARPHAAGLAIIVLATAIAGGAVAAAHLGIPRSTGPSAYGY